MKSFSFSVTTPFVNIKLKRLTSKSEISIWIIRSTCCVSMRMWIGIITSRAIYICTDFSRNWWLFLGKGLAKVTSFCKSICLWESEFILQNEMAFPSLEYRLDVVRRELGQYYGCWCHGFISFLVSSCSCLCPIQVLISQKWRCSWSSADRRCSNYIWVINIFIAF